MKFTRAIVRKPCKNMVHGLTTAGLGKPDYKKALAQHEAYIDALLACGLEVLVLDADEQFPDSTFVEDTALLTPRCAIITRPGAASRTGETAAIEAVVKDFYSRVERIHAPGTLDAGDVMMTGDHYYIGLSSRTNQEGAAQLLQILNAHGYSGSIVNPGNLLHLKSGVAYLEDDMMAMTEEFLHHPFFSRYRSIAIPKEESYAANCVWVNGQVLCAAGFRKTIKLFEEARIRTIALDMSEFQKLDGGLSCLSLRF